MKCLLWNAEATKTEDIKNKYIEKLIKITNPQSKITQIKMKRKRKASSK